MSTSVRFTLPETLYHEMLEHARAELPNECCGMLMARTMAGEICRLEQVYRLVNALSSPTEYLAEGDSLVSAVKHARQHGLDVVGFYHSHPTSRPIPSQKDRERNHWGEVVHFIISLATEPPEVRAWWLTETAHREAEWQLIEQH